MGGFITLTHTAGGKERERERERKEERERRRERGKRREKRRRKRRLRFWVLKQNSRYVILDSLI